MRTSVGDPRFKNELTRDAAPIDPPPPPPSLPPPAVRCTRGPADALSPPLFASASAVFGVLFPSRSPSSSEICSPVCTAEVVETAAAAADTGCGGDGRVTPLLDGLTTAADDGAAAGSVSNVSETDVVPGATACEAEAAAAEGLLF